MRSPDSQQGADDLVRLASLIRQRNAAETEITQIIGRPAALGHLGEHVASRIFGIALARSATEKGIDGHFASGPLQGRSVNVKWYAKQEGMLDIARESVPDYYLVLTGPRSPAAPSRGLSRPWVIAAVYLFDARLLSTHLETHAVKVGVATSVREGLWEQAEIYPMPRNAILSVSDEQRHLLGLFA